MVAIQKRESMEPALKQLVVPKIGGYEHFGTFSNGFVYHFAAGASAKCEFLNHLPVVPETPNP